MREKSKKFNKRLLLVLLLVVVTIGYATLQTSLTINGTSKINNSTWDIHFETVTPTPGSVTIDSEDNTQYAARIDTNDNTKVGFSVVLNEPGDFYEFTVKAVNGGSIDAMVDTVTKSLKINDVVQNTIPDWLTYTATYSDGVEIAKNHILAHESFETYKIRVEFKRDITNEQFNAAKGKTLTLDFDVKYIQKGEGAITVNHLVTMYGVYPQENQLILNSVVPANAILHLDPNDALADWTNANVMGKSTTEPFYLKHEIENNIIKENYVVFVVTEEMAAANSGMQVGTYELKAEQTYNNEVGRFVDADYVSPYYESNFETLKTAFGYSSNPSRCRDSAYGIGFYCEVSGLNVSASASGDIIVNDEINDMACVVSYYGEAMCF